MKNFEELPVKVMHRSNVDMSYDSNLNIISLTTQQRLKNAFMFFGLSLLAALAFAPIPVLHFVLVPLAIMIGCFLFYRHMSFKLYRFECVTPCPGCKKDMKLKASAFNWPIFENCQDCRAQILIDKK